MKPPKREVFLWRKIMGVEQREIQNVGWKVATAKVLYAVAGRLDGVRPIESQLRRAVAPIHIVNDFNDYRSHVECEQEVRTIFKANGVLYESPHIISDVEQFNVTDGAFKIFQLVSNLRRYKNPGIFVGVVDPGVGSDRRGIVVTTEEGYTFIGPNNGLFYPSLRTLTVKETYQINPEAFKASSVTFHGRDQFTPLAAEIACGKQPSALVQLEKIDPETLIKKEFLDGQVVETDGYPNIKIWQDKKGIPVNERGEKPKYLVVIPPRWVRQGLLWSSSLRISVADCFEDVAVGEWLVYEGSSGITPEDKKGLIEIAIRNGSGKNGAGTRLGVKIGDVLDLSWRW